VLDLPAINGKPMRRNDRGPINLLAPNDIYVRRTAQLTCRLCILNIYSTNILTEYSKHAAHSPFFFSSSRCRLFHNAIFFGSCNIHILNTEYFKHAVHSPVFFFTSRCRLFHNAIFFGSCNIHILNTGCAKILKKIPAPKG
jgi:hypothetical protein